MAIMPARRSASAWTGGLSSTVFACIRIPQARQRGQVNGAALAPEDARSRDV
jgi:hypothetical protein